MTDHLAREIDATRIEDANSEDERHRDDVSNAAEGLSENGGPPKANREERIRTRAFYIWEGEGAPHGRDLDHWQQSESEIDAEPHRDRHPLATMEALREASLEHTNTFLGNSESKTGQSTE